VICTYPFVANRLFGVACQVICELIHSYCFTHLIYFVWLHEGGSSRKVMLDPCIIRKIRKLTQNRVKKINICRNSDLSSRTVVN